MDEHGIDQDEAKLRMEVQNEAIEMLKDTNLLSDEDFVDIYIEHEPKFSVVVAFSDKADRKTFQRSVSPKIRRHIKVITSKNSAQDIQNIRDTIENAAREADLKYLLDYNPRSEKFTLTTSSRNSGRSLIRSLPEEMRKSVQVKTGAITIDDEADWMRGGSTLHAPYSGNEVRGCTAGYSVSYDSGRKQGIMTAAHCGSNLYVWGGNSWVFLGDPDIKETPFEGAKYSWEGRPVDYAIYNRKSINVEPWVYYRDLEAIPEFPDTGWYKVKNQLASSYTRVGWTVCKSGMRTGITCGKITSTNFSYTGIYGFIKVGESNQSRLSRPGDSGGPWFLYPGTGYEITAVGIHKGNPNSGSSTSECFGTECEAIYTPVDFFQSEDPTVQILK